MHTNPIHATADLQLHHRIKPKLSSSKSYTLTIQWQLSAKCLHGSIISSQEVLKLYILAMAMVDPSRSRSVGRVQYVNGVHVYLATLLHGLAVS